MSQATMQRIEMRERSVGRGGIAVLTLLRVGIGWHFLYEGLVKILDTGWTAKAYLASSSWLLSDVFHWIAAQPRVLALVDTLNAWGLALVGAGLMLGLFTRAAGVGGMCLLALYYIAHPPFHGGGGGEGSYLFVDKNLVEMLALLAIVALPAGRYTGLDRLLALRRPRPGASGSAEAGEVLSPPAEKRPESATVAPADSPRSGRREMLKAFASLPFLGAFVYAYLRRHVLQSAEERALVAAAGDSISGVTGATTKSFQFTTLDALETPVPSARIGNLELSRVILGGNLIGGWAHARDLIYVSKLVKAYHHEWKVFETLRLAEACGINTILTNPKLSEVINRYWKRNLGKIQFISDCALKGDLLGGIRMSIDNGAHACYVQGGIADRMVEEGRIDEIARALEVIREAGLPAGIGAHRLATVKACVDAGFRPDFWMKTLHTTDYWSAQPKEEHNNIWCRDPGGTVAYMKEREEPWIAFKVLAAGALEPETAFRYAFESGADFICVGMYDFQIVDDVNLAVRILKEPLKRERPSRV